MLFEIDNSGFHAEIEIADSEIERVHRPLLRRFADTAQSGRAIVLVAGPPASGKTVLCEVWRMLAEQEGVSLASLSMDGFHFPNAYLSERGLLERKGSPETFNVRSLTIALAQIHAGTAATWPIYDRNTHEPVAEGIRITDQRVVVAEGNYFLLAEPDWSVLRRYASTTVRLDVGRACLRDRLLQRHVRGGSTQAEAERKYAASDLHNIVLVDEHSVEGDIVLMQHSKGGYRLLTGGGRGL